MRSEPPGLEDVGSAARPRGQASIKSDPETRQRGGKLRGVGSRILERRGQFVDASLLFVLRLIGDLARLRRPGRCATEVGDEALREQVGDVVQMGFARLRFEQLTVRSFPKRLSRA